MGFEENAAPRSFARRRGETPVWGWQKAHWHLLAQPEWDGAALNRKRVWRDEGLVCKPSGPAMAESAESWYRRMRFCAGLLRSQHDLTRIDVVPPQARAKTAGKLTPIEYKTINRSALTAA
ncbi:hypothetical protein AB4089_22555 [Arthrobacter sp. 2MCAF15]